jgi:hypothetical protein
MVALSVTSSPFRSSLTPSTAPPERQSLKVTDRERNQKRKEKGMVVMVGIILVDYLVLTMPGLIVIEVDVTADRNNVRW